MRYFKLEPQEYILPIDRNTRKIIIVKLNCSFGHRVKSQCTQEEEEDTSSDDETWHDAGGSPQQTSTGARPKAPTPAPRRSQTPPTPAPRTRTPSTPGDSPRRSPRPLLEQLQKKKFKPFDPRKKKTPPAQIRFQPTVQLTPLGQQVGAKTRSRAGQLFDMVSDPEKILRKKRSKSPREGE